MNGSLATKEYLDDVGLVVAAAGAGRRFSAHQSKALCQYRGQPLFTHCLRTFLPVLRSAHVVLVVPPREECEFRNALAAAGLPADIACVPGGDTRTESVANGLAVLPHSATVAAIQDAARPETTVDILRRCVESARERGAGVAARRVTDTIKVADAAGRVRETPDRSSLWAAETPQVFRADAIRHAYRAAVGEAANLTDDAQAFERLGEPVYLVENPVPNPKITYRHDLNAYAATE